MMQSARSLVRIGLGATLFAAAACGSSIQQVPSGIPAPSQQRGARTNDARVGLSPGLFDAGEAAWNLKVLAEAQPPQGFRGITNSDLAFTGNYAIQGNYNGLLIWDISNPARPTLVTAYTCPASQNDVSVYRNLLFMSAEANNGRVDCRPGGVPDTVSRDRIRGIRIFDISDIRNPRLVANVQTCRGSHTHTLVESPSDRDNVYIYVSGSAGVRSPNELPGCSSETPDRNPQSSLLKIEIIRVPLARPQDAQIVSRADIFTGLQNPATHPEAPEDLAEAARIADSARRAGGFTAKLAGGEEIVLGPNFVRGQLDSIVRARGGSGAPTAADSATLRANAQTIIDRIVGPDPTVGGGPVSPFAQCHDITVYPALGVAGGACEGHGLLLDIRDPTRPVRIDAVSDPNFSYWHSATFNNDGTKILFSDEWGGGGGAKCRAFDRPEWGADAIFTVEGRTMTFKSYYKLPAAQTATENCVAHNGSLIPIPGRDIMVQSWYQGGISVFEFTDPANPREIAYFDRGPINANVMQSGGSWSAYWYNGAIYSSEIARGLDVTELTPSEFLTQNEIDAAKTVRMPYFNTQAQPKLVWPPSFPLARAYVDQLERSRCMSSDRIAATRQPLSNAERATGSQRAAQLTQIANGLQADIARSCDAPKVRTLQTAINDLARVVAQ